MGYTYYSARTYAARAAHRAATGMPPFAHTAKAKATGTWTVHPSLDPHGVTFRESCDSEAHPNSVPIMVIFDVTGSMTTIPELLQKRLPDLMGLLVRRGYVPDPQILFGAFGDAWTDRVPLQIGQFESGNEMDECLEHIALEGMGGGQKSESSELALYFAARHTHLDSFAKRGKRGYLFLITDEKSYAQVDRRQVKEIIGDDLPESISTQAILDEVRERFETYVIIPTNTYHGREPEIRDYWSRVRGLGQNVLTIDDVDGICGLIALTIGLSEGTVHVDEGAGHLTELGVGRQTVAAVTTAVGAVAASSVEVATSSGPVDGLTGEAAKRL